jgi:hypothetical protein
MYNPDTIPATAIKGAKEFRFLAIGKWEERKDYQTLIEAYLLAFTASDDVTLIVRAKLDDKAKGEYDAIFDRVAEAGVQREMLPHVLLLNDVVPRTKYACKLEHNALTLNQACVVVQIM